MNMNMNMIIDADTYSKSMSIYERAYNENKTKYLQIGGKNIKVNPHRKWMRNLWGNEKNLRKIGKIEVINKPKLNTPFIENARIQFSFVPEIYDNKLCEANIFEPSIPINNNAQNRKILTKLFKSSEWKDFLEYTCCDNIRSYITPFYEPEMFYLDDVITELHEKNNFIIIVIKGTIKKYTLKEIKRIYTNCEATNKTWQDTVDKIMTFDDYYYLITEAFYKWTNEGEMVIPKLGRLSLGIHTHMKLEYIT